MIEPWSLELLQRRPAVDIQESMHQILDHKDNMATLFYAIFFERYPEVRPYFEQVSLPQQAELLRMTLMIVERHYNHSYPATAMYLKYLGTKHHTRGIPAQEYPKFRDALLATLEQFHGQDWNPHLDEQWKGAIDRATALILEGYQTHFTI
jgi:hemoglobin-like flavoprotein